MSNLSKKTDIRQSHSVSSNSKEWQHDEDQDLYEKSYELEWFRRLYESMPCICFTLNSAGKIIAVSQFGADYLGYRVAELTQKSVVSVFYQEEQAKSQNHLISLQQQPTQIRKWEVRLVRKNGSLLWAKASISLVSEAQSNPIISLVCEDITAYKQIQETQQRREESFRATFEQAHLGISHCKLNGRFVRVNQKFCEIFGYTQDELRTRTFRDITFPDDLGVNPEYMRSLLAGEIQHYEMEKRYLRKDGVIIWGHQTVSIARDSSGQPQHFIIVVEDISQRKFAEEKQARWLEALCWKEAILQTITSTSPLAFYMVDNRTDAILYFNRRFCEIWGIEHLEERMQGGELKNSDIIPDCLPLLAEIAACADFCQPVQSEETHPAVEDEISLVDGRTIRRVSTPIRDESQPYVGHLYIFEDVTKRKQVEEALRQQFLGEQLIRTIAGRIHQSLNLEEILNTTVAEVRQFLECDRVIIFRIHTDGSGVVVVESVGCEWIPMSGTVICDQHLAQNYIQLYQQGRIQAVEDIYTASLAPCHRDLLAQFQVRANLVVPIVHEEQLWGLLVAQQCSEPRNWQPSEIDLLKSLSTQAAIAIQQSELYQQAQTEIAQRQEIEEALRQQFQRERLIGAIAGRIRRSLKLEKILKATVAEVRQVLQTDRVIIFRFEPDWSGNVVVESVASNCFSILGRNIYDPCFEEVYVLPYKQGRVMAVEDIYAANLSPCHLDLLAKLQVRANLVVPILNNNQLWGLLVAHHCCEPRQWQQWEIDLLLALAAQAAIAIQHSQLYEQAKSHFLREQLLNQLTQVIRSSLDLETIFATAVREIGSLLEVDYAHIVQYLPEQQLWLNVSEYRKSNDLPVALGMKIPAENNQISDQLKRLEIVNIQDANTCKDEIDKDYANTFPGAWLLVPLHFGDSVWGSLGLVKNTRPYRWQDSEVELICAVADQIAIAIQQAELYQQSRTATTQAQSQTQQLEQALIELQNTQSHLVQSEKMSSLGQLVAGVAHEINNPVSFIYGNLVHASGYTQDILGLLQLYQQHYPNPAPEISSEIKAIDLEFLTEDLPKLLSSMKLGAERICEIVAALRTFSRIAEAEVKAVNLHEGLDSTLMILQNRLKASGKHPEIQVIREYGNLPLVECYAGQLNQVFMNLLVNAIDAIDEQIQMRTPVGDAALTPEEIITNPSFIRVRTELINDHEVAIRIADNGPGMTEDVKARLFDPFFTTKPVGTGTGLGLSISYQIVVEKHGGQLRCYSLLGQGTEFVIQIPLSQKGRSAPS